MAIKYDGPKPLTLDEVLKHLDADETAILQDLGIDEVAARMGTLTTYDRYKEVVRVTGRDSLTPRQTGAFAAFAESLGPNMVMHYNGIFEPAPEIDQIRAVLRHESYERNRKARDVADNGS